MDFEKYKLESPEKYKKAYAWETAIGLQKVDDLTPSSYLYEVAQKNIEENLSFEEVIKLLNVPDCLIETCRECVSNI